MEIVIIFDTISRSLLRLTKNEPEMKKSLNFENVVLLGRTCKEYTAYFGLTPENLKGKKILDVGGGVSSFCAEVNSMGINAKSVDPIYNLSIKNIELQCKKDLENVISQLPYANHVYSWKYYKNIDELKKCRVQAYKGFITHFSKFHENYIQGGLPKLPVSDKEFDISLVSHLLFLYSDRLTLDFHIKSILELIRISKQEVRIYPLSTLEGKKSRFIKECLTDQRLANMEIEIKKVDFEFFKNSNEVMIIKTSADTES